MGLRLLWIGFFALQAFFARDILFKGQRIKQFHAYSISESLAAANLSPLFTTLPCAATEGEGIQRWVEEPPIFHGFAALLMKLGIRDAAVAPFLVSLFACFAVWSFFRQESPERAELLTLLFATTPLFSRYVSQHMPDMLALAFWALGAKAFRKNEGDSAAGFFALSVTTKALFVFPVFFFLFAELRKRVPSNAVAFIRAEALSLMALVPFGLWLFLLHAQGIPNPFSFTSVLANRHAGTWGLLLQPDFYGRMWTWLAAKGVGLPMFFAALAVWVRGFRDEKIRGSWAWLTLGGTFVYWLFVRGGNFTHDYYTLPFLFPWVALGANALLDIKNVFVKRTLIAICFLAGFWQPFSLAKNVEKTATGERPSYCGQEAGKPLPAESAKPLPAESAKPLSPN